MSWNWDWVGREKVKEWLNEEEDQVLEEEWGCEEEEDSLDEEEEICEEELEEEGCENELERLDDEEENETFIHCAVIVVSFAGIVSGLGFHPVKL